MDVILATSNAGKIKEFQALVKGLPMNFIAQKEHQIESVDETGLTFIENAILKARHAAKSTGLPALADDSGLCVDALGGEPGVFSARYGGVELSCEARNAKLLSQMEDVASEDRTARFHSVIVLLEDEEDPAPLVCHGIWEGEILREPRGAGGFGYDPIFFVPDQHKSAAELDMSVKNSISHRGQAMAQFKEIMLEVFDEV